MDVRNGVLLGLVLKQSLIQIRRVVLLDVVQPYQFGRDFLVAERAVVNPDWLIERVRCALGLGRLILTAGRHHRFAQDAVTAFAHIVHWHFVGIAVVAQASEVAFSGESRRSHTAEKVALNAFDSVGLRRISARLGIARAVRGKRFGLYPQLSQDFPLFGDGLALETLNRTLFLVDKKLFQQVPGLLALEIFLGFRLGRHRTYPPSR